MKNSRIHISIGFGDIILPVVDCEDGHERVSLQSIAKEIGITWQVQTRKLQPNTFKWRQLGLEKLSSRAEKVESIYIRVDKVIAFMHGLNPDMIRSKGNDNTADWLETKIIEWDEAVYAYESTNGNHKNNSGISDLYKLSQIKGKITDKNQLAALNNLINIQLSQMGQDVTDIESEQRALPFNKTG